LANSHYQEIRSKGGTILDPREDEMTAMIVRIDEEKRTEKKNRITQNDDVKKAIVSV